MPQPRPFAKEDGVVLGAGFGLSLLILFLGMPRHIFAMFTVLLHEFGHALFGWLFGYPSIPKFDFAYGGGMTFHQDQKLLIILVILGLWGWGLYLFRKNRLTRAMLGGGLLIYLLMVFTSHHMIILLFMGHGTELVFAIVFLYRAVTCSGVVHSIERPLYAASGFFIILHDIYFAWGLVTNPMAQSLYARQKGSMHFGDFSRIGLRHLGASMETVAAFFLLCCLLSLAVAFLVIRYRAHWHTWLQERLRPGE